jgi:hypothetical protein
MSPLFSDKPPNHKTANTPAVLLTIGIFPIFFTALLAARIVWEETLLTWHEGPQMVGFSLAHGAGAVLLLAPLLLILWLLAAIIRLVLYFIKKRKISAVTWATFTVAILILVLLVIPPNFWQWQFAGTFAKSPHAGELLNYAAVQRQVRTTRRLVSKGVPVTATDRYGNTPLHSAAASGSVDLLQFFSSRGADLNALNLYGDSPLERAMENHQAQAAQFLKSLGAKRITGSPEQRERATEMIVRRQIENLHQSSRE